MLKQKIIIDCDPGHDDAIALILASYSDTLDLIGVTTTSGNQTIEKTSLNASNLLNYFSKDISIGIGASKPISRDIRICPEVHGESGLDGFVFPTSKHNYDSRPGYIYLIDLIKANPGVIIVTTGPMTNLALALTHDPSIKSNISQIVLMGGSTGAGNITKEAEFNILVDPEAADICFKSGLPMKMLGLNVTRKILVNDLVMREASKIKTRGGELFIKLMEVFNKNQREFFGLEAGPLHDPATIISLINQKAFKFEKMDVRIDTSNTEYLGKTWCSPNPNSNILVATEVNLEEYWSEIYKHLRRCK